MDKKEQIRQDLQSGKTIDTVCREYDITFKDLVYGLQFYDNPISQQKPRKDMKFIYEYSKGYYAVSRWSVHFGSYSRLSDARKVRSYLMEYGWKKSNVDKACELYGIVRRKR